MEGVRVGIGGHALLKHKTRSCTLTGRKRNRTSVAVAKLTKFLCISSILFLTLAIMLSNMPKGFLTSCAADGGGKKGTKM